MKPDAAAWRRRLAQHAPATLDLPLTGLREAAVLVPVLVAPDGAAHLLFTVRSAHLKHHAGQIAFPGGKLEEGESIEVAACREAHEEVGLVVPEAALLGRLSPLPSPASYLATPVVAVLPWPERLRLDPTEVEEAFTAPMAELAALTPQQEVREFRGSRRVLHRYPWRDRDIWGFTGNVLREFLDVAAARSEVAP